MTNENLDRRVNDTRRLRSPTGWAVGAVFVVALLGIWLFYSGRPDSTNPSSNSPNVVTNSAGTPGAKK